MAPPKERKRRFHRRSKNGCQTCKKRHVRTVARPSPKLRVPVRHDNLNLALCIERALGVRFTVYRPYGSGIDKPCMHRSRIRNNVRFSLTLIGESTNCLQTGSECIYPFSDQALPSNDATTSSASASSASASGSGSASCVDSNMPMAMSGAAAAAPGLNNALNDYVGGSFDALPEPSKRLLRHFSQFAVWGQRPVVRELQSPAIQKSFENPGYMHMCLMLSACQWAWVTGSMDEVRIPFLYHKAATYQFAREQLQSPETAQSGDTMLAISALALTEGATGELDASTRHLKGIRSAIREWNEGDEAPTLPQRMLKMRVLKNETALMKDVLLTCPHRVGEGLRTGKSAKLVNVPEYQPTFMALLFASIWDITALPPREAPRYGWWEDQDTQAARLWQNHTRDLNLNYEISRDFNANQYIPRILNGDPRSSRTSFIATFFYLCSELGPGYLDVTLIDWLLEQLIDDVNSGEENLKTSTWTQPLWLWCVMFGAAISRSGRTTNVMEERQMEKWRAVYNDKMRLVSRVLGIDSWHSARTVLAEVVGIIDEDVERSLEELWDEAVVRGVNLGQDTIDPAVIELMDED
ncbi:hypothetical protein G7046_g8684 [Stylonectria norvegica]|nr:hypothetical protein G7046_g8684 [Stylonectria norvegica]